MRRLIPLLCSFGVLLAVENPAFFAMDTAARLEPAPCAQALVELGYAGLGGRPATARAHATALAGKKLTFFNAYHVTGFMSATEALPPDLVQSVDALAGLGTTLWLGISKVESSPGVKLAPAEAEVLVVTRLRQLLAYAKPRGVRVSLYPHARFWAEQFEVCLRIAEQVGDPTLGVTFNLCHWLKVEGSERDPMPLIRQALPRLDFVTINGADGGDTRNLGWDKLIQPLGRGTFDVASFVAKVRDAGYRRPFGFQGYGIRMEPKELLAETMDAWKKMVR